jgi:hypothetical protein
VALALLLSLPFPIVPTDGSVAAQTAPAWSFEDDAFAELWFHGMAVVGVGVDLAYYHVFENEISGPMFGPTGPIAGSSVSSKMYEDSFIMTFSFTPDGM